MLIRRSDDGAWGLPGGGVDPGEDRVAAARRECREGTGGDFEVTDLFGVYSDPATQVHRYADGRLVHFLDTVLLATASDQVDAQGPEVHQVAFFGRGASPSPLVAPDEPVLRDFALDRTPPAIG